MARTGPLPSRSSLARRPRRRLVVAVRRQPILFWTLAGAASVLTYVGVAAATERIEAGAAAYGDLVPVVVAVRDLDAGTTLAAGDLRTATLPADLVPAGSLRDQPLGRTLRSDVVADEALVEVRLAPDGAVGVAASLFLDERAVAIPTERHRAPFEVGQVVDVLATADPSLAGGRGPTTTVAVGARVLDVDDGGITVAVDVADADGLATALATSVVTVVVAPG